MPRARPVSASSAVDRLPARILGELRFACTVNGGGAVFESKIELLTPRNAQHNRGRRRSKLGHERAGLEDCIGPVLGQ